MVLKRQKEYERIFKAWRYYDFISTFLSVTGLVLAIVSYELEVNDDTIDRYTVDLTPDMSRKELEEAAMNRMKPPHIWWINWVVFGLSMTSGLTIYIRHYYVNLWK